MTDDVLDSQQGSGTGQAPPPPPPEAAVPPPPPPGSAAPALVKADVGKRLLAGLIDGVLAGIVGLVPFVGGLVGTAYMLVRDGLEFDFMDQRSIGKKVMKLRPIRLDGQPMDLATSIKRNIPLAIGGVGSIFWIIPVVGWAIALFAGIIGLIVVVIETILILTDSQGRRMGDKMAETMVVEVES